MEIAQGQRRWDGVPKIPTPNTLLGADERPEVALPGGSAEVRMEEDGIKHSTDHGDLSPTAPYEPKGLPSQLVPPPPSECQNCSSGFRGGFAEQYWEDHLRQPAEGTVPRETPARLQDLAETWYAETLSMQRGL